MRRSIQLCFALLVACGFAPAHAGLETPYTKTALRPLELIAIALAKSAHADEAGELRDVLAELGYPERQLSSLDRRLPKLRQKPATQKQRQRIAEKLGKQTQQLAELLVDIADPADRERIAAALLRLDEDLPAAQAILGRVEHAGRWVSPELKALSGRRAEVQAALQAARQLEPEITVAASDHPLLLAVHGAPGYVLQYKGFTIYTAWPISKARRLMSDVVRALALSKYLIYERPIELPWDIEHVSVLFSGEPDYLAALAHDVESGSVKEENAQRAPALAAYYRRDGSLVNNRLFESHALGGIFAHVSGAVGSGLWGERDPQPTLVAGHVNWVLMALAGASLPGIAYDVDRDAGRSSADLAPDSRQLLAGAGLMGARSWLQYLVTRDTDPAWSRTFVDVIGKIEGVDLLKATFVAEYLHYQGPLAPLIKASRIPGKSAKEIASAMETGLGESVLEFEARWRAWMRVDDASGTALLTRLRGASDGLAPTHQALLDELARIRDAALVHPWVSSSPRVTLDEGLSAGALLHARYLERHPHQVTAWPDAHEEYTDHEGFTPEGGWAGNHSIIVPGVSAPEEALDAWMGTYFHRLPLLDPGLLRVGWGLAGKNAVLDAGSMVRPLPIEWHVVWPPDGMSDVPRRFRPELPDPFPGVEQSAWGYPITLQLGPREAGGTPVVELTLRQDKADGELVESRVSSPQAPGNPLLVPQLAWCLIPMGHLEPKTTYFVTAEFRDAGAEPLHWSFTTGR